MTAVMLANAVRRSLRAAGAYRVFGKIVMDPHALDPVQRVETGHRDRRRADVDTDSLTISIAEGRAA